MLSRVPYPLPASTNSIDPSWAQAHYSWAYDLLNANGIDTSDDRWEFSTTEHGLHPLTYRGWWVFVVYYDDRLGVVIDPERFDSLRSNHPGASIEICGRSINDLLWVLIDTTTIALEQIKQELEHSINVLTSSPAFQPQASSYALVLLWNPENWDWQTLNKHIAKTHNSPPFRETWKVKNPHLVHVGMPTYIYRTGKYGRGFMASGTVVSPPYVTSHFRENDEMQTSVDVIFDTIIDPSNEIPLSLDELNAQIPDDEQVPTFLHSGVVLRHYAAERLQMTWGHHVHKVRGTGPGLEVIPDTAAEFVFAEGALRQLSVNSHERSGAARDRAIAIHGTECCVCGINFEHVYGEIGKGFIHIHHLDPIANAKDHRPVDPRRDLVPVCPNCHAMLHRRAEHPYTPDELKRMMGR